MMERMQGDVVDRHTGNLSKQGLARQPTVVIAHTPRQRYECE